MHASGWKVLASTASVEVGLTQGFPQCIVGSAYLLSPKRPRTSVFKTWKMSVHMVNSANGPTQAGFACHVRGLSDREKYSISRKSW